MASSEDEEGAPLLAGHTWSSPARSGAIAEPYQPFSLASSSGLWLGSGGNGTSAGVNSGLGADSSGQDTPLGSQAHADALKSRVGVSTEATSLKDINTIDWIQEGQAELKRTLALRRQARVSGIWGMWSLFWDSAQAWILLGIVGAATAIAAAWVDVGVEYLSDVRTGFCSSDWMLPELLCCPEGFGECPRWRAWSEIVGFSDGSILAWVVDYLVYVLAAAAFAGTASWFVVGLAPEAAGSGIPQLKTILGGAILDRFLGLHTLVVKAVGLCLAVGGGLLLGKEGPLVQIASCIAWLTMRFFPKFAKNGGKQREVISAAAACGVSVAFGAPVGGVLFSLEEASTYFPPKTMWRAFFAAIVGAIVSSYMNPHHTFRLVLFQVNYRSSWHWFELPFFMILGVLGGIVGAVFIKFNVALNRWRKTSPLRQAHPVAEVALIGAATALISFWNPFTSAPSGETLHNLFSSCEPIIDDDMAHLCNLEVAPRVIVALLIAAVIKLVLVIFTFGAAVPAGLFVPSLTVGALMGRALGAGVSYWHFHHPDASIFQICSPDTPAGCVTPGIYAIVGAAAALGGVTRMTVSLVVVMFELTGGLDNILPIMVAIQLSKWAGDALVSESIYDQHINLAQYPFLDPKANPRFDVPATAAMTPADDLEVIVDQTHTVAQLASMLEGFTHAGLPVVRSESDAVIVGYAHASVLLKACRKNVAAADSIVSFNPVKETASTSPDDVNSFAEDPDEVETVNFSHTMDSSPVIVAESTPLNVVYDMFKMLGIKTCLVTRAGALVGMVTKKDLLHAVEASHAAEAANRRLPPVRASSNTTRPRSGRLRARRPSSQASLANAEGPPSLVSPAGVNDLVGLQEL